jgi:proliferating cell nuclear antigen
MDIDAETLGVPETEYKCIVTMPATEFQRIIRDISVLGDNCTISVSKEGVKFTVKGDIGTGNILRKNYQDTVDPKDKDAKSKENETTSITIDEPTELSFALRYLNYFTKATSLATTVSYNLFFSIVSSILCILRHVSIFPFCRFR